MLHTPDVTWSSLEGDTKQPSAYSSTATTSSVVRCYYTLPPKVAIKYQSVYLVVYLRQILAQFRDAGGYRVIEASEKAAMSGHGTVSPACR